MFAPNLVYATVQGSYPRLLADDGVHEALILPHSLNATVPFDFHHESHSERLDPVTLTQARYIRPDGSIIDLMIKSLNAVVFEASLPPGGVLILTLDSLGVTYQAYPIRVLRPTDTLQP